jgi:hypothetical protein
MAAASAVEMIPDVSLVIPGSWRWRYHRSERERPAVVPGLATGEDVTDFV